MNSNLVTPVLQGCGEEQIWGETPFTAKDAFQCQDRSMLVKTLGDALIKYELVASRLAKSVPQKVQQDTLKALERIDQTLALYGQLRQRRALLKASTGNTRRSNQQMIQQAWNTVQQTIRDLTFDDYAWFSKRIKREARIHLLQTMHEAFDAHGPFPHDYSQSAVYDAMAKILIHFGIENGTSARVAERIRKRLERPLH